MKMKRCPNKECVYDKAPQKGEEYCPECGTKFENLGFREAGDILNAKKLIKDQNKEIEKQQINLEKAKDNLLFTETTQDDDLKTSIQYDMLNLSAHEAGSGWMRVGTLLSFNPTQQMIGAGFKAIIDQNKILIKQNEQILRELKKLKME